MLGKQNFLKSGDASSNPGSSCASTVSLDKTVFCLFVCLSLSSGILTETDGLKIKQKCYPMNLEVNAE